MDIRIEKTDRAIEKAFMELRARQPLEDISIHDVCTLAEVDLSTVYAHYDHKYNLIDNEEDAKRLYDYASRWRKSGSKICAHWPR